MDMNTIHFYLWSQDRVFGLDHILTPEVIEVYLEVFLYHLLETKLWVYERWDMVTNLCICDS